MDKHYKISRFGVFADKSMEQGFQANMVSRYSKSSAFVALIFGFLFILFLGNDYEAVTNNSSFMIITITRMLFLIVSAAAFFMIRRTLKHTTLICILTAYAAITAISYLIILQQYATLTYLSILGLMVTTLAIYILPNKVLFTLLIAVIMSILFFLFPAQKIEGLEQDNVHKAAAYQIIVLIHCTTNAYLTNLYKRKQYAANAKLMALSITDPLTGIYNRAKFDEELERWTNFSNRYGTPLSLIIFDIDDFKIINDSHGHLEGDSIIKHITNTTMDSVRNTDIFARWGGDEFVILLPNTNLGQAEEIAERMRKSILEKLCDAACTITCSFGVSILAKDETAKEFLLRTDKLLLQAKAQGKDLIVSA